MIQAPEMTYRQLCDYLFENKNVSHVKFKMAAVVSKVVAILGNRNSFSGFWFDIFDQS